MRKIYVTSASVLVGSVFALLYLGLPVGVRAGMGPTVASQNGDVNGDGSLDVSDAVFLLVHLFRGGEPPVSCADSAATLEELAACRADLAAATASAAALSAQVEELRAELAACRDRQGLPHTGQRRCFDAAGTETPCDSGICPGQDGAYVTGCPMEGRFVDNGDGTVTDNCTGLMWQQNTADVNGDGQSTLQDVLRWCDALAYCEDLSLAGFNDWRLPSVLELQSIVDYERSRPATDPVFSTFPSPYFSSTTRVDDPSYAWGIGFSNGQLDPGYGKVALSHVRAVRGP